MQHQKIEGSSQIYSLGFDPISYTLEAKFICRGCGGSGKDGRQPIADACSVCLGSGHKGHYEYPNIPVEDYAAVRDDKESVGAAFNRIIKGKKYAFRKIS